MSKSKQPRWLHSPYLRFGFLTLGLTFVLMGLVWWLNIPLGVLGVWLLGINLVTYLAYRYDKAIAGSERMRVPEILLLGLAFIGGSLGAFGGMYFPKRSRHKTRKMPFVLIFWVIVGLQIAFLIGWWVF